MTVVVLEGEGRVAAVVRVVRVGRVWAGRLLLLQLLLLQESLVGGLLLGEMLVLGREG